HWVDATGAPRAWVIGVGPHARNAVSRLPVGTAGSIWVLGGFCGALDPALISGDVLVVQGERLLEKLTGYNAPPDYLKQTFLTVGNLVSTVEAKERLWRETQRDIVDMETAIVVQESKARGVPLIAVRVVSDAADQPIPLAPQSGVDCESGRANPAAFFTNALR